MTTISLAMIVKDEEFYLSRIVPLIHGCFDEIVAVDTGSTDETVRLLTSYGAKVSKFSMLGDFAAARNFAVSLVSSDWCFTLDADEAMLPQDIENLKQNYLDKTTALTLPWYEFAGDHAHWRPEGYPDPHTRIFKMHAGYSWRNKVHEQLFRFSDPSPAQVSGHTLYVPSIHVYHYGHCKLPRITRRKIENYSRLMSGMDLLPECAFTDNSDIGIKLTPFEMNHPLSGVPTMLQCGLH